MSIGNRYLKTLWLTALCIAVLPFAAAAADGQPNIIVLFADDLGYGELGCQGNDEIPTPHIDSIAENGIRFTNGYVTAPYCSASRAGIRSSLNSRGAKSSTS